MVSSIQVRKKNMLSSACHFFNFSFFLFQKAIGVAWLVFLAFIVVNSEPSVREVANIDLNVATLRQIDLHTNSDDRNLFKRSVRRRNNHKRRNRKFDRNTGGRNLRIPNTDFTCKGRKPGYYADMEANCRVISCLFQKFSDK